MADNYCKCCGDGTPEYIIELNQQGAPGKRGEKGEQGYSPIVDFIADDNEIKFTSTNENNVTSTPNLYDYVLKRDGTNALNPIRFNNIFIKNNSIYTQSSSIDLGNTANNSYQANIYYRNIYLKGNSPYLQNDYGELTIRGQSGLYLSTVSGNISLGNSINIVDNIPYIGTPEANNKIATMGNIPKVSDSTITIKQGKDIKGSFTLNQENDAIITLDSGIVNPLEVYSDDKTKKFQIKYDSNNSLTIYNDTLNSNGGTEFGVELMPIYSVGNPLLAVKETSWTYAKGLYTLTLNYDNDTLKVNGDNKLYADFTPINNSITTIEGNITELTTLANNTEASLNKLKIDYESNKTNVAEELTTLGNQLNNKANLSDLSNYVPLTSYNELLARVEALEAEINGGNA